MSSALIYFFSSFKKETELKIIKKKGGIPTVCIKNKETRQTFNFLETYVAARKIGNSTTN
jgi:hypothetical protein